MLSLLQRHVPQRGPLAAMAGSARQIWTRFSNPLAPQQSAATVSYGIMPLLDTMNNSPMLYNNTSLNQQIRCRSNRSRRGLYEGTDIRFGNKVSFSHKKTRRKFKPNVFKKRLYSETLDKMIRFHVTCKALKTIDKYGGLDNYLLSSKHVILDEGEGGRVKRRLLDAQERRAAAIEAGEDPDEAAKEEEPDMSGLTEEEKVGLLKRFA